MSRIQSCRPAPTLLAMVSGMYDVTNYASQSGKSPSNDQVPILIAVTDGTIICGAWHNVVVTWLP